MPIMLPLAICARLLALLAATLSLFRGESQAAVTPGEILIGEMNCVACHQASSVVAARLGSRPSPRLDAAHAVHLSPEWLRAFLENPQATQPGTLMPDLLASLEPQARAESAEALTHYLVSLRGEKETTSAKPDAAVIAAGRLLYHEVGCVACHAPTELPKRTAETDAALPLADLQKGSVPFGDLPKKYSSSELTHFLQDPLKSRPGGRMPSLKLSADEARNIALFLLHEFGAAAPAEESTAFVVDPIKAASGQKLYADLNCAACHQLDLPARPSRPLAELNARQPGGCLASKPRAGVPKFELSERQRVVILSQLGSQAELAEPLTPTQQIARTMTTLNCYACHTRNRRGGLDAARREYFSADLENLPPSLQGAGKRLSRDVIEEVLLRGRARRPDATIRMPLFGAPNVGHLPELFITADAPLAVP